VLVVVAGCGGAERERAALPADVGSELAAAAGDVTAALEAGDPITAQAEAAELLAAVEAALSGGDVPRPLAREVRRGAERLVALVDAAQPPPPAPPPPARGEDDDGEDDADDEEDSSGPGNGKGKGKAKGKDKDKGKDDE
jgi:hypothetical protein